MFLEPETRGGSLQVTIFSPINMQAVDWSSRSLFKRIQSRNYPKGGPGEAPGLPPAIMVNEIRAKDEAGSLWKRVEVCTEAWAVCACMPACIYSSSFLTSSQDPNSGGKAEAPVFFMHGLGASVCSSCRYIYVPNYGDDVGRPRTEVCDLCR